MTIKSRDHLSTSQNPYRHKEYSISLSQKISRHGQEYQIHLCYVPDKLLLCPESWAGYLDFAFVNTPDSPETLAHDILEDIMDQIIPRWVKINLHQNENKFGQTVQIKVEDFQPGWKNDRLLQRP